MKNLFGLNRKTSTYKMNHLLFSFSMKSKFPLFFPPPQTKCVPLLPSLFFFSFSPFPFQIFSSFSFFSCFPSPNILSLFLQRLNILKLKTFSSFSFSKYVPSFLPILRLHSQKGANQLLFIEAFLYLQHPKKGAKFQTAKVYLT